MQRTEAQERRAAAGRANLARWKAQGKPNLRHGVTALLDKGVRPPGSDALIRRADKLIQQTIRELGGKAKLNAKQLTIIEAQRITLRVILLASDYIAREGLLEHKRGRPHPLLTMIVSFINSARLNAEALGLADTRPVPTTIDEILAEEPDG